MILTLILFTVANIFLALVDAHKIIKGKWILHGLNAAVFIALLLVPFFLFKNYFLIGALLFNRLIFFNIFLSLFRGKKWNYVTPENPPKSIIDRLAKMVFGMDGKFMYAVYAGVFIILTVITFL